MVMTFESILGKEAPATEVGPPVKGFDLVDGIIAGVAQAPESATVLEIDERVICETAGWLALAHASN
jgi:hypothetical protein